MDMDMPYTNFDVNIYSKKQKISIFGSTPGISEEAPYIDIRIMCKHGFEESMIRPEDIEMASKPKPNKSTFVNHEDNNIDNNQKINHGDNNIDNTIDNSQKKNHEDTIDNSQKKNHEDTIDNSQK
ncbi:hypothetical protein SPVwb_125 [Swinepox virus]|nr:hypothetical protein SPVwb_125 [Swinepox virus]